jgi:hypothetical protein
MPGLKFHKNIISSTEKYPIFKSKSKLAVLSSIIFIPLPHGRTPNWL